MLPLLRRARFWLEGGSRPLGTARPSRAARPAQPAAPIGPARLIALGRLLLAVGCLVVLLGLAGAAAWWWSRPAPPYHLPAAVGERHLREPLLVELVIDESGSNAKTDPHGVRSTAAAEFLRWMGRNGRAGDRVGVIQFAKGTIASLPLAPVGAAAARADASTTPDPSLDPTGTDIPAALALAVRKLGDEPPGGRRLIVLFTDGASDTPAAITPIVADAHSRSIHIDLIALDGNGSFEKVQPFWDALRLTHSERITGARAETIARSIAVTVTRETGQRLSS